MCASPRHLVDQSHTGSFELAQLFFKIRDTVSGMVQFRCSVAALAPDCRRIVERTQQLDGAITSGQSNRFDALIGDRLVIGFAEAEGLRVQRNGCFQIRNDDGDVVQLHC